MTAKINLLPWREEFRQQKKLEFFKIGAVVLVAGIVATFVWGSIIQEMSDNQQKRNAFLQEKIDVLDEKVKEIVKLKERRQQLLDRLAVIQSLQGNRSETVRVFDEMTVAIPEGVYLASMIRARDGISLTGYAESNNRVSAYMRNLDQSYKFTDPNLTKVEADDRLGEQGNTFDMRVKITEPEILDQSGKGA